MTNCLVHDPVQVGILAQETGPEFMVDAQHVMHDQHLSVALGACADADRGYTQASGYLACQAGGYLFQDDSETTRILEQQRILAASVVTLDAYGQVVRAFQPSEFFFRGGSYSVQFRPRENEAYVMVSVDPTLVGQVYSAVNIGTGTSGTYAAGVYASWTYGMDQSQLRTFSYEGTAAILVNDSDTDEEG